MAMSSQTFYPLGKHGSYSSSDVSLKDGDDGRGYLCTIVDDYKGDWLSTNDHIKGDTITTLSDQDFQANDQMQNLDFQLTCSDKFEYGYTEACIHRKPGPIVVRADLGGRYTVEYSPTISEADRESFRIVHVRLREEDAIFRQIIGDEANQQTIHQKLARFNHVKSLYFIMGFLVVHERNPARHGIRDADPGIETASIKQPIATTILWEGSEECRRPWKTMQGNQIIAIEYREFHKSWHQIGWKGAKLGGTPDNQKMFALPSKRNGKTENHDS